MNQTIHIIGRLGRDPEMKFTPNGQAVTAFSVATDRQYTKDGEPVKETIWFRVEVWGKQAEACNTYLQKGALVYVIGRMKAVRAYIQKDGTAAANLEVSAERVTFLGGTRGSKSKEQSEQYAGDPENMPF